MSALSSCTLLLQIVARAAGQIVAPEDIINMKNPKRLEQFTNSILRACDIVNALRAKQAASQQEVQVSREHRIEVRRLQRQQAEAQALASDAPVAPPSVGNFGKRKRGGVGVSKKCSACGLHKTKDTGHTKHTCPTHCLKCKRKWQNQEQKTGCSCRPWL